MAVEQDVNPNFDNVKTAFCWHLICFGENLMKKGFLREDILVAQPCMGFVVKIKLMLCVKGFDYVIMQ